MTTIASKIHAAKTPLTMMPRIAKAADGYRGVWYAIRSAGSSCQPYNANKYGGAMATYPQQHSPIAIHREDVEAGIDRTYFVFGGFDGDRDRTPNMIGYYDHTTGLMARPRIVLTRSKLDAHENPTLCIDEAGYLWMFSPGHGYSRRSMISRSAQPYEIDQWVLVAELPAGGKAFAYSQPHYVPGQGFLLLNTHYIPGSSSNRTLYWNTSADGIHWDYDWEVNTNNARPKLAAMEKGQYQTSWRFGQTVATIFNMHPSNVAGPALDRRSNLYYLQTSDCGKTWHTANGSPLSTLPLTNASSPALVFDYHSQGRNVYLKDVQQDAQGNPLLLYLTSGGAEPGPSSSPRVLHTARYVPAQDRWIVRDVFETSHNYDHGSLYVETNDTGDEVWRLIGPWIEGPQPSGTGGEIGDWISIDQGETWQLRHQLTSNSDFNHSYVRRPLGASPGLYGLWANGHAWETSDVNLYFTTQDGVIYQMPYTFKNGDDFAAPTRVVQNDTLMRPATAGTTNP